MVNYDEEKFTLWQVDAKAEPGAIKAIGENGEIVERFCANASEVIDVAPSPTSSGISISISTDGGLSGGAIAGIVIGAIVAITVIAAFAFIIFRRRRSAKGSGAAVPNTYDDKPPMYIEQHAASGNPQFPVEIEGRETQAVAGAASKPIELHSTAKPMELQAPVEHPPQELDSTAVGK